MEREFYLGYSFQENLIENTSLIELPSIYSKLSGKKLSYVTSLINSLKKRIEKNKEKDTNLYLLGLSFTYLKKHDLALEYFKKAYELNTKYFEAYFYSAGILYSQKKWGLLKNTLDRLIELKPAHFESLFYFGLYFYYQEDYLESQYYFKLAIESNPYSYECYYNLAVLFYITEKYDKSFKMFKKALKKKIKQKDGLLFLHLGNINYQKKNYLEAEKYYKKFLLNHPQNYIGYYNLGLTYSMLGNYKQSLKNYQRALNIHPIDSYILNSIAILFSKGNQHKKSVIQFQKALIISPNSSLIIGNIALELTYQMEYKEAEKYYKKSLNMEKNKISKYLFSNYANFLLENSRDDEAFIYSKKILEYDSKNIEAINVLGIYFFKKKNYIDSIHIFQKIFEIQSPHLKKFYLNYEKILYAFYKESKNRINENHIIYYIEFAKKLFLEKEYKKVIKILEWIIKGSSNKEYKKEKIFPKSFYKIGKYKKSIELYREIFLNYEYLRKNKDQLYLAKSYYSLNQFQEALFYFEYLRKTKFKNRVSYYLAKIQNKNKNYTQALKLFKESLDQFPEKRPFIFFI